MADNLTTTTQVDPGLEVYYDRALLQRARPYLIHEIGAQVNDLPVKSGDTIKFRRYAALTVATTPLTEGVTPAGQQLSKSDLTATVKQYGDYVHVTDVVDLTVEDKVLTEAAELLGEQEGDTRDTIMRDILVATASLTLADGGSNADTPTELTKTDIDGVVKALLQANCKFFFPNDLRASTGVGTGPVRQSFIAKASVDIMDDLEQVSGFKSTSEYPTTKGILNAEWGSTGNVRWLLTTNGAKEETSSTLSADVYPILIHGKDAFGTTTIGNGNSKNIRKGFGSAGTADPLNQRATSGWKMMFTGRILNDSWLHVLKVTLDT